MEKGIIAFTYNSRLKFSRFVGKLQATTAVQKRDAIIRLITTPLRMCRNRDVSQ